MEVSATAKYIRVQPRKVRIIADEVRGKNAGHAAALLHHHTSKGAKSLRKVLINAVANAVENHGLAPETLKIATIMVDEGPRLKRMTAKAMGRGARILKKTSHITVVVEDVEATPVVRPHGTKAKARPTFATKPARGPKSAATPSSAPIAEPADSPSTTMPESTPVQEPEVTPGAADATAAVQDGAAAEPVEATPVTSSDAPEETGGDEPETPSHESAAPVVPGTAAAEASPVTNHNAPEEAGAAAPAGTNDGESSPEAKGAVENEEHNA